MQLQRFRVAGTFSGMYCVGQNAYSAGQEFTLREDQARRWISTADIEGGYIIPLPDAGGEQGQYIDAETEAYVDGKDGTYRSSQDFDRFAVTFIPTFTASGGTALQKFYPDCDCTLIDLQFVDVPPPTLLAVPNMIDVRKYTNGTTDGGSFFENPGTNNQMPTGVLFYDASAGTYTDYTASNILATANGIVLSSMATADYLYIGGFAPFDGFTVYGAGHFNDTTSVMTCQYPMVDKDGAVTWTDLTISDKTSKSVGGDTMGEAGGVTWLLRPGDWKRTTVGAGTTYAYWVRFKVSVALDSDTTVDQFKLISRILYPYDNSAIYVEKGDMISIDSPIFTASSFPGCTAVNGYARTIVLTFARVR